MVFTAPTFMQLMIHRSSIVHISCSQFYANQTKNIEGVGNISHMSLIKVWLSQHIFSQNHTCITALCADSLCQILTTLVTKFGKCRYKFTYAMKYGIVVTDPILTQLRLAQQLFKYSYTKFSQNLANGAFTDTRSQMEGTTYMFPTDGKNW